ncbi:hypothetical protein LDVICp197 [lymphocystis disease virus-China]|uniref:Uncharacterized protein n=1 Tax=lymphocystis disease virus-China TaxID=256729 RepID=Q677R7_9VIRU|nr:hypothetical protein LDVICp197 [lymphocystis disease virus-China]AAU11040.1 hypothetical protein [lymphocystis disease virus-China]
MLKQPSILLTDTDPDLKALQTAAKSLANIFISSKSSFMTISQF